MQTALSESWENSSSSPCNQELSIPSTSTTTRPAVAMPMLAFGVSVHHCSICSSSVVADLKPSEVRGCFDPGTHGKTGNPASAYLIASVRKSIYCFASNALEVRLKKVHPLGQAVPSHPLWSPIVSLARTLPASSALGCLQSPSQQCGGISRPASFRQRSA